MRNVFSNTATAAPTQPVNRGGTGAVNVLDAANNLLLLRSAAVGTANSAVPLNASSQIDSTYFTLAGDNRSVNLRHEMPIVAGVINYLKINDYQIDRTYSVSTTSGDVWVVDDTIILTAPATEGASFTVTVNGTAFGFVTVGAAPVKPVILSPLENQVVCDVTTGDQCLYFYSSPYASRGNYSPTHASTDWQISTSADFATIHAQSLTDATNLTSWVSPTLAASTTYYVRCRHRGSNSSVSEWSQSRKFRTRSTITSQMIEEATVFLPDIGTTSDLAEVQVRVSEDGTRFVFAPHYMPSGGLADVGMAYIFARTRDSWSLERKILPPSPVSRGYFGLGVDIDSTGTRVVVGCVKTGASPYYGRAYVYVRSGTTWTQEATLTNTDAVAGDWFGSKLSCDSTCTRVLVCAPKSMVSGSSFTNTGKAYIFTRTGTTWAQEASIKPSVQYATMEFGYACAIARDGTRVYVTANGDTSGSWTATSAVYVFSRSVTTWTQEAKIVPNDNDNYTNFGFRIAATSTRLAVGAPDVNSGTLLSSGAAYVFSRSGTTWTQEAKLTNPNGAVVRERFGRDVAFCEGLANNRLLVAARGIANSDNENGKLISFTRSGTTWSHEFTYENPQAAPNDNFGKNIATTYNGTRYLAYSMKPDVSGTAGDWLRRGAVHVLK